jgi:hypothetical protein
MFEIRCNNCRETNQLNDRMKDKTVRCHICMEIIQVGEVKEEVIVNINKLDNHEKRIKKLEDKGISGTMIVASKEGVAAMAPMGPLDVVGATILGCFLLGCITVIIVFVIKAIATISTIVAT